jgi:hypothetical protein
VWRAQPVVEVCAATHYPAWRKARERAWKRDGNTHSVQGWPERIAEGELAAVLLMQSHGGQRRGQPAEIAAPGFARGFPARGHDVEHPDEPLALALWSAGSSSHSLMSARPRCSRRRSST